MLAGRHIACLALLLCSSACALFVQEDRFMAHETTYDKLPGWEADNHAKALAAFLQSCPLLADKPRNTSTGSGLQVPQAVWESLCAEAKTLPVSDSVIARQFFERRFSPWRITNNGRKRGLFTGYYEPLLFGAYKRGGDFQYPLYRLPSEIKDGEPYYTHAEINGGALDRLRLELVWVDDPVMRFFMQIQGSGRLHMTDGRKLLIGYAGKNNHPYVSLGKIMIDEGLMAREEVNLFSLRQWLYKNPDRAFAMMEKNPSYVFFRRLDTPGVVGASGAVLTPLRSLAVDSRYIPYGLPLFLEVELPAQPQQQPIRFNRLMIAQDTGGAIRGPVRGDIFFGGGDEAEYYAGHMKGRGSYALLVPREVAHQLHAE